MTWDKIDNNQDIQAQRDKANAESKAKAIELDKKFNRVFNSDDGKVVFEHLYQQFVMNNDTPLDSKNVTYEAGYHAGESGVIKFIIHKISNATKR